MVKDAKNLIVGLDIGTSKIVAIVAEVTPEGELNIIGLGTQPSRGLRRGVVVNIEATMASIQRVLEEAELMADCRITEVYTGVAGSHIKSLNSSGMVAIKEKEVTQADIDRVVETAKAIAIPNDQQILHILPQEFIIDGQEDVREPLGDERGAPRGQGTHRDRRRVGGREHREVRAPLRPRGEGRRAAAARLVDRRIER